MFELATLLEESFSTVDSPVYAKFNCPVRAKLRCPNYPSEDEVREAEIGLGDDEWTRTATHRGSF
jgi:hypothetical protein